MSILSRIKGDGAKVGRDISDVLGDGAKVGSVDIPIKTKSLPYWVLNGGHLKNVETPPTNGTYIIDRVMPIAFPTEFPGYCGGRRHDLAIVSGGEVEEIEAQSIVYDGKKKFKRDKVQIENPHTVEKYHSRLRDLLSEAA